MTYKKTATYITAIILMLFAVSTILYSVLSSINTVNKIRIACIGDSITKITNYPYILQARLGANYTVGNFGSNGATVLLNTDAPYMYRNEFVNMKRFQPNIAVIMLGTNDARADRLKSIENFVTDYERLIKSVQAIGSKPKIFLVKPPPIFDNKLELKNVNLVEAVIPRIEEVAKELGLPLIDVYSALKDHPEYFQDGVHPNTQGAMIIANEVYKAIIIFNKKS